MFSFHLTAVCWLTLAHPAPSRQSGIRGSPQTSERSGRPAMYPVPDLGIVLYSRPDTGQWPDGVRSPEPLAAARRESTHQGSLHTHSETLLSGMVGVLGRGRMAESDEARGAISVSRGCSRHCSMRPRGSISVYQSRELRPYGVLRSSRQGSLDGIILPAEKVARRVL